MNMNCSVNFETRSLVVTRYFLKRASVSFSEEYEMLARLTQRHPDYTIKTKAAPPRKPQFMPTYEKMAEYIRFQENDNELMEKFNMVRMMANAQANAYMYVRNWFLMQFPEVKQAA